MHGYRILVIEDDVSIAEVMGRFFDVVGYRSQIIDKTTNLLTHISDFKPDLILLDFLLPQSNGGELCRQVKENNDTKQIPVIIYSAYPMQNIDIDKYGCDAFIAKPFDLDFLQEKIEQLACTVRN